MIRARAQKSKNAQWAIIMEERYGFEIASGIGAGKGEIMARRGRHSFIKYEKELKRKKKAMEKMARRQGKKNQATEDEREEAEN